MASKIPKYRRQRTKTGDRGFIELGGVRTYLGAYDSAASRAKYGRLIAEWEASGGHLAVRPEAITITELTARYWQHCESYYVKDGKPTSELGWIQSSLKGLVDLYGNEPAQNFGPLKLRVVRDGMVARGWTRKAINSRIGRIKRMFRWATESEIVAGSVYEAIRSMTGLREGRTDCKESRPIVAVPQEHVEAVLEHVSEPVGGMIRFQLHTGCRPSEARLLRGIELNMDGSIWEYKPATHKTIHHGHERLILLGPKSQQVVKEFLKPDLRAFLFDPLDAAPHATQPTYDKNTYLHAVASACRAAGVPHWSPNQIRHLSATKVRAEAGLAGAQLWLGHRHAKTSEIYAEQSAELARRLAAKFG